MLNLVKMGTIHACYLHTCVQVCMRVAEMMHQLLAKEGLGWDPLRFCLERLRFPNRSRGWHPPASWGRGPRPGSAGQPCDPCALPRMARSCAGADLWLRLCARRRFNLLAHAHTEAPPRWPRRGRGQTVPTDSGDEASMTAVLSRPKPGSGLSARTLPPALATCHVTDTTPPVGAVVAPALSLR